MIDGLLNALGLSSSGHQRASIEDQIGAAISERMSDFGIRDAMRMPSVRRSVDIIVSIGASLEPVTYRSGRAIDSPNIVARPDPFRSRYDFTALTIRSFLQDGEAFWRLGPGYVVVLDPDDVTAEYDDDSKLTATYTVNGKELALDKDIKHLRIGQQPGRLHGTSPIREALDYLAILAAQERFARSYFDANGQPHTVLSSEAKLTPEQAKSLRDAYVKARGESGVAVLGMGADVHFPPIDPERAQLTDSRDFANTEVARLLGIPAPMLHVNLSGTAIYYQNVAGVVQSLARQTVLPLYMAPIEGALSELAGDPVRYSVGELQRVDIADRTDILLALEERGVITAEQVGQALGLDPAIIPAAKVTA